MSGIADYSTTPSSNTAINGINIAEGCMPANLNNAVRQIMADVATFSNGVGILTPERYGAIGDNVTNDREAIRLAMLALVALGGGTLQGNPNKTYFIGDVDGSSPSRFTTGLLKNCEVRNLNLRINTTADGAQPYVFQTEACLNVTFDNVNCYDSGSNISIDWRGAHFLCFSGGSGASSGITLRNCHGYGLVAFIEFYGGSTSADRVKNIIIDNCSCEATYYGILATENGDNLTATNFNFVDGRRAVFVYGASNVRIDANIKCGINGANGKVMIKRYRLDTGLIKINANFSGDFANTSSLVRVEHQPNTGTTPSTIGPCDVTINVDPATINQSASTRLACTSYTAGGVEEATTTNIFKPIALRGSMGYTAGGAFTISCHVASSAIEGVISLDPNSSAFDPQTIFAPGWCLRLSPTHEVRMLNGNLNGYVFNADLTGVSNQTVFGVKALLYAHDNASSFAVQKVTYREDFLALYNAGGGAVTVISTTNTLAPVNVGGGTAATIAYSGSGEKLTGTITGADYTNASAFGRLDLIFTGRVPARY